MKKSYIINAGLSALLSLVIVGCHHQKPEKLSCDEVTTEKLGIEGLTVLSSEKILANADFAVDHCKVLGRTGEHTGIDNQEYAINFELRLPDQWNKKFIHQFNGGNDGT